MATNWFLSLKRTYLNSSKFVRFGLPFVVFMISSSFGLKEFTKLRYQFTKVRRLTDEECAQLGKNKRDPSEITPEAIYEREIATMDTDNWENVRGPRPWEKDSKNRIESMKDKAQKSRDLHEKAQMDRILNEE